MRTNLGPRLTVGLRKQPPAAPARPAQPMIGPWEIVREVHEGAMFRVLQVRPADRPTAAYALKVLLPRWEHVGPAIELLATESLVGRSISNAHLIAILSTQLQDQTKYVIMPWLAGANLASLMRHSMLPTPFVLWIVRQVAEALEAIHAGGWRHGDIKPENIVVSPQGHATLIDLGFARRIGERITAFDDCLCFTAAYAAPELSTPIEPDQRSDLYSLGATMYEALSGSPPFAAVSLVETIRLHREARPRELTEVASDVPVAVAQLVHQLLSKDPLRRPHSAREVIDRLLDLEIETLDLR